MNKSVLDYQSEIMSLQNKISEIQSACKHDQGYECVMYSYRVGAYSPTRMCYSCRASIPGITEEESQKVYSGFYTVVQQTGQMND